MQLDGISPQLFLRIIKLQANGSLGIAASRIAIIYNKCFYLDLDDGIRPLEESERVNRREGCQGMEGEPGGPWGDPGKDSSATGPEPSPPAAGTEVPPPANTLFLNPVSMWSPCSRLRREG